MPYLYGFRVSQTPIYSIESEVFFIGNAEHYIAKIIFSNRILQYTGQQYEDFFVSVMTKANPNFQPVKAYGNIGDMKNDGFDYTTGTYYQVFSPEDITKDNTIYDAIKKLKTDFIGLYSHWNDLCPIKKFFFVVNDKYKGVPAPIIQMTLELNSDPKYEQIEINTFTAKDLEKVFISLDDLMKQDIIGYIPDEIMPIVEYEALHETVTYLLNAELPMSQMEHLVVPNFDEKIAFNGLSAVVNSQLVTGSYQEGNLMLYFNDNPGVKEILQKKFNALYEQAKGNIPNTQDNCSDCRFYYILEKACSKNTIAIQTSVLVLMAYYFSSCDIFEEPQ